MDPWCWQFVHAGWILHTRQSCPQVALDRKSYTTVGCGFELSLVDQRYRARHAGAIRCPLLSTSPRMIGDHHKQCRNGKVQRQRWWTVYCAPDKCWRWSQPRWCMSDQRIQKREKSSSFSLGTAVRTVSMLWTVNEPSVPQATYRLLGTPGSLSSAFRNLKSSFLQKHRKIFSFWQYQPRILQVINTSSSRVITIPW